jgi:hypothetical protein
MYSGPAAAAGAGGGSGAGRDGAAVTPRGPRGGPGGGGPAGTVIDALVRRFVIVATSKRVSPAGPRCDQPVAVTAAPTGVTALT